MRSVARAARAALAAILIGFALRLDPSALDDDLDILRIPKGDA